MRLSSTLLICTFTSVAIAHAQDPSPESARSLAAARSLFEEGVGCADAHDWTCAEDRFGRARVLRPSPVILSNHGIALEHLGRLVEASETFRSILRDPTATPALRRTVQQRLDAVIPRLGRMRVVAIGATDDVAFSIDGEAVDASLLGVAMPIDPGAHEVQARRASAIVASAHVDVAAGGESRAELRLPPPPRHAVSIEAAMDATLAESATASDRATALTADSSAAPRHEIYEEWWLWTIVGVVVVGAGVGVTAAVLASNPSDNTPSGSLGTIDVRP